MFFEIFQSLSLTTGAGGLFDFGATLPLVAIQFLILMFILNTILYNGNEVITISNKNLGNRFLYGGTFESEVELGSDLSIHSHLSLIHI